MLLAATHRPRNVDTPRAAALLYGDLGTSKAYVIGLAYALAGYASFWLVLAVSVLTVLIGINYITICKYYPNGGGVYASVRRRSPVISMIGAFFLAADYFVTAALSALSAFFYFGVDNPVIYAALLVGFVGLINYFGPRHTGSLALIIAVITFILLIILAFFTLPELKSAWNHIQPLKGNEWTIWTQFTGVIVALSGIEAIANTTGVMRLDPGTSYEYPRVTRTAKKAILIVILEVGFFTAFFAFTAAAIGDFEFVNDTVNAPGNPNVRDYMLGYLSKVFTGSIFGPVFGEWFSHILSFAIGILLLSAVNTAINGLVALQYLMASDGEVPGTFRLNNKYGVPIIPLIVATAVPITLVLVVEDVAGLAALYAIGFVGAIATNLGSTSTDFSLGLNKKERTLMFFSFLIMLAIEITLFIDKPAARTYALAVIAAGLILRGLSREYSERKISMSKKMPSLHVAKGPPTSILCTSRKIDKALQTALERSKKDQRHLNILYVREQTVISEVDLLKTWKDDPDAVAIHDYAVATGNKELLNFYYSVSDSPADIIAAYAMRLEVKELYLDMPHHGKLYTFIQGNFIDELRQNIPEDVEIILIS